MITLPAHIARLQTLTDGSWRMVVDLGELDAERIGEVGKLANKVVCIGITLAEEFTEKEQEVLGKMQEVGNKEQDGEEETQRTWG